MPCCFNRQTLFYRLPVLVYCLAIFIQSGLPSSEMVPEFDGSDKLLHVAGYLLLGALMVRMIKREMPGAASWQVMAAAAVAAALYGLSDEWHQSMVPARDGDFWDVLADTVGAILGAVLFYGDLPFIDRAEKGSMPEP